MDDSQKINNDNNFTELMTEFQTLSTFAEVKTWSQRTGNEIERIAGIIRALSMEIARHTQTLERLKYEHSKKPLVGRLFSGGGEEKELTQIIEKYQQDKSALEKTAAQLQESIDFTPKSSDEQQALLKELRQHKKELQEKKREITMVIRGPRTDAQSQNAQVNVVFDAATLKRRKIRYAMAALLLPQEKTKESVDRQLAQLDGDILWAEKFNQ